MPIVQRDVKTGVEQNRINQLVQQHAATFFAQAENAAGADRPKFVKDEFGALLECGVLIHGSLRLRARQARRPPLQAPGILPLMRRAAHVSDGGALGRQRHPARVGAAAGAHLGHKTADPPTPAAGRTAQAGEDRDAGGAPRDDAPSA